MSIGRGKGNKYKKKLNKVTFGLFDTLIDVGLFIIFLQVELIGTYKNRKDIIQAGYEAIKDVKIYHPKNLKRVIYRAANKKYLQRKKDFLEITKAGRKRLAGILPQYEAKRVWDGVLYLITYDIPEERKKDRDYLRGFLQDLGCGMLQHSVWITPYNPKRIIGDFVIQNRLVDLVLVSELREGSNIGGRDMLKVLKKVYNLEELNQKYRDFIQGMRKKNINNIQMVTKFLSILKQDPQLPFELLPEDWLGQEAYFLYKKILKSF